eukprot:scaffold437_cov122-Isochrysis_galbana.AAC.9
MLLRVAHVRAPPPPPLRSGVGGVAVTRPEGNASIATTRHPHSHHTHTHSIVSLSQHTSPPYHRAPPSLVGAIASYPPSSHPRRTPRVRA